MLKRKNWKLFNDQVENASSGQDDTDREDDLTNSPSAEEVEDSETTTSSEEDEPDLRRLEDLSEDDFDEDSQQAQAVALKEQWLAANKQQSAKLPRAALACRLCKGVLLLGPDSLVQHLNSKKHRGRRQYRGQDYEPICFATSLTNDSKNETHRERLERLKAAVSEARPANVAKPKATTKKLQSGLAQQIKSDRAPRPGRPGKRQRAELKEARATGAKRGSEAKDGAISEAADDGGVETVKSSAYWTCVPAAKVVKKHKRFRNRPRSKKVMKQRTEKGSG